jgi:tetratricopeptide (TPR) repeat protein
VATIFAELVCPEVEGNMTEKIRSERARDLIRLGDIDGAWEAAKFGLAELAGQDNDSEIWRLRFIRAQLLDIRGKTQEALAFLEEFASGPRDPYCVAALKMHRASYTGYLGRYEISHRLFVEAETLARETDLLELLGETHLSRAFIFFRQKDYSSSDSLFRMALELSKVVVGWRLRGYSLWGIGKNLMIQECYKDAMQWLDQSLAVFAEANAPLAIAMVWGEQSICHLGLGDDETAIYLLRKAERVEYESGSAHNYQITIASIGNIYLHRCDYFTAISYYQRALAIAREIKDPVSVKKWTRNINLAYARIRRDVDERNPRIA